MGVSLRRIRRVRLLAELARVRPDLVDAEASILAGRVLVEGGPVLNPDAMVTRGCSIVVMDDAELRGSAKLASALDAFGVEVGGRIALDVGAAAGGFTSVLLERGAARIYAVDAGHGQLLGSLRQDPHVVNLEATNVGDLDPTLVTDAVQVVTVDVSYLSLTEAVRQLDRIDIAAGADLIGLVKPMFELRLATAPTDWETVDESCDLAASGVAEAGWTVVATMRSSHPGAGGALEGLLHARLS